MKRSCVWIPALVVSASVSYSAHAGVVEPIYEPDNPSCPDHLFEYKIDSPESGVEYAIPGVKKKVTVYTADKVYFDWQADLCMDAVIAKGGPGANSYYYDPTTETCSDEGLHPPINPENYKPYGISHIKFCYDLNLEVKKTAKTSFKRRWEWKIDKSSEVSALYLALYQVYEVMYKVAVTRYSIDSDHKVEGKIYIHNPAPVPAYIDSVEDEMTGGIPAYVDCGVYFPYALPAYGDLECSYEAKLPDGYDRVNKATVKTTGKVGGGYATADVKFSYPTKEVDKCATVHDSLYGSLGEICADKTFYYSLEHGPFKCGDHEVKNVATLTTKDTYKSVYDDHVVKVYVKCPDSCTLTQGYWKTHSEKGPAPYDETWAKLEKGAYTKFFDSGKTWHEMFWTPPKGNKCVNLAHQYMAAYLNVLNDADPSPIVEALAKAQALLYPWYKCPEKDQKEVVKVAEKLDEYNNGHLGPPHCSE